MYSQWVIGVLSTDYDLHDYRNAVIARLKQDGIIASAFELSDFPVEPYQHSHDSCLTALKRTHIVVLIIDKRYGGIYYDSAKVSITESEYLSAVDAGIPCLVFVKRRAWDERHDYLIDFKNSGKSEKEFDEQYKRKYVDSVETIHFIDRIHKAYDDKKISNWINFFDDIQELTSQIIGKMEGLSRFWIKQLVNKQRDKLMARKTSTCFSMSLGDVFDKGYYLKPEYYVESGSLSDDTMELDLAIVNKLSEKKSILIYGEAGYGKTTILAKSFLQHVDRFNHNDGYDIPFYIWLKDKTSQYHFDFEKYLQECFEEYYNREAYPYLKISSIVPYFYLDGFDEISEKLRLEELNKISQASIFKYPLLLTSRIQYAMRYLESFDLSNKFDVRIKINQWDKDKAKEYIDNFCAIRNMGQEFKNKIYILLADNGDLNGILDNPLLITMLLWVIEENRMDIPETISSRVELFQECIKKLARRECSKWQLNGPSENELILIWSYFAWVFYRNKLLRERSKIKNILSDLQNNYLPEYGKDYNETFFEAIFDTKGDNVFGTFHEQFLEFMVANTLHFACLHKKMPYPEFLRYVVRPEINRYFRGIWHEDDEEEKNKIAENIFEQYLYNAGLNDSIAVRTRVHAVYHVSRLEYAKRKENIARAFNIESNISVRLSLFFGAIKMGQLDKEQEFYNLLISDEEYNTANRGYHLAYYSDMPSDGNLPFVDNGQHDWIKTLRAFIRHFESDKREQHFMRRIDLVTMLQFMESRQSTGMLNANLLKHIEELIFNPVVQENEEFQKKIEDAFKNVKSKYEQYC